MLRPEPILHGRYYHIFNRGINSQSVFYTEKDFQYFLHSYQKYIPPVAETFAFCLMKNHFHFLIRIKEENEIRFFTDKKQYLPSRQISHLFNSYTRWFNKIHDRTGPIFEKPFKRKNIDTDLYFKQLVIYIHTNPIHHEVTSNLEDYKWSSYNQLINSDTTKPIIQLEDTISWFDDNENFINVHKQKINFIEDIFDT